MESITIVQITPIELAALLENAVSKVLSGINFQHQDQLEKNKPLRLKAAADFLGVAETTLYSLVHQGRIKPLKPGKHLLFTKESLEAYLRGERPEAQEKPDPSTYLLKTKKAAK